jgi:hypothetical protein
MRIKDDGGIEDMGWISVDDRLPKSLENVLVFVDAGDYSFQSTGSMHPNKKWTWHRNAVIYPSAKVTHWMPLPQAPDPTESA